MTTATATPTENEENPVVETPEKTTPFVSFCKMPFDPSTTSDCFLTCKEDFPVEYDLCLKNFETQPKKKTPTKAVAGGKGKSFWGHLAGSQAGLIDECLSQADSPKTLEEISDYAKGRAPRVLHHIKHLYNNLGVPVFLTKENAIFWKNNPRITDVKSETPVISLVLRKPKEKKEPVEAAPDRKDPETPAPVPAKTEKKPAAKSEKKPAAKTEKKPATKSAKNGEKK